MRKKLAIGMATALVIGTVVALFTLSSSATAATTLTVVEHNVTEHITDVGKAGPGAGDLLTFHNPLFDSTDTSKVGTDQGSCIRITKFLDNNKGSWECEWTTFLNSGADSITVESPFFDNGLGLGAITGGTGTYVGASGSLELNCYESENECTLKFNFS
jgi:allene oxide cyclase